MWQASAELHERTVVRALPQVTLQEMLHRLQGSRGARGDVRAPSRAARAAVGARAHERHPRRAAATAASCEFMQLFRAEEGRIGVTVTFIAILELMREGLIDVVQTEPYAPLHVRAASAAPYTAPGDESRGDAADPRRRRRKHMSEDVLQQHHRGGAAGGGQVRCTLAELRAAVRRAAASRRAAQLRAALDALRGGVRRARHRAEGNRRGLPRPGAPRATPPRSRGCGPSVPRATRARCSRRWR